MKKFAVIATLIVLFGFFKNATQNEADESAVQTTSQIEPVQQGLAINTVETKVQDDVAQSPRSVKPQTKTPIQMEENEEEEKTEEKPQWGSVILKPQASFGRTRSNVNISK